MKKLEIEIAITSLATGRYAYYNIEDKESLNEAIEAFEDEYNKHDGDWEIQCVDWSYEAFEGDMLNEFVDLMEEFPNENPQDLIYLLKVHTIDDTRYILHEGTFYTIMHEDNKYEAFEAYVKEYSIVEIPEHLECFINYEAMCHSWECGGLKMERVSNGTYLIVSE